jgi:uncharacterized protein DUF1918
MEARSGDHIIVEGSRVGQARREGDVLEVVKSSSSTYYRVRWGDGHETVFFPSSDTRVAPGTPVRRRRGR